MSEIGDIQRIKWKKYIFVACPHCLETRWMRLEHYKRGGETGQCRKCAFLSFAQNPERRNKAEIIQDGYVLLRAPGHPHPKCLGRVKRAVLVIEKQLGRYLKHDEHVHHINGKRDDDRPENLMVLTNSEHARLHQTMKRNVRNRYQTARTQ